MVGLVSPQIHCDLKALFAGLKDEQDRVKGSVLKHHWVIKKELKRPVIYFGIFYVTR